MDKKRVQAVVFDMDGVLVDNTHFHNESWQMFCRDHDIKLSKEELSRFTIGRTVKDVFRDWFGQDISDDQIEQYREEKERYYRKIFRPNLKSTPGLMSFLNYLREQKISMSIATSGHPENVDFIVDGLKIREYFSAIINSDDVTRGKPDPQVYLLAAERLCVNPEDCLAVEDTPVGVESAKNAKMKCLAVLFSYSRDDLKQADYIIKDFTEFDKKLL